MRCPVDGSELSPARYERVVAVDRCSACKGIWLAKGKLETVEETHVNNYRAELAAIPDTVSKAFAMARAKTEAARSCPRCGDELYKAEYAYCSQIMIDRCPHGHGVWLDQGELKELEIFFERATAPTDELREAFLGGMLAMFKEPGT